MTAPLVLVADDAADFRELARLLIETWGAGVLEAGDFHQVVEVAQREHQRIGLVLLDYFMPGDRERAVAVLRSLVEVRDILLCSACGELPRRATELGLSRTLAKPIDVAVLERTVREVMSR